MSDPAFPPEPPQSRMTLSRGLRILLVVSLALNMFFLGAGAMLLGRSMGPSERGFPFRQHGDFPGPGMMMRALPQETRERVEKAVAADRAEMRAAMAAAKRARREAFEAFAAQPFSAEIYKQKGEAAEAADVAAVRAVHKVIARVTDGLTAEERVMIAEALKTRRMGPGFGQGGPGGPMGPPHDRSPPLDAPDSPDPAPPDEPPAP